MYLGLYNPEAGSYSNTMLDTRFVGPINVYANPVK
jgi:hypothetical protein